MTVEVLHLKSELSLFDEQATIVCMRFAAMTHFIENVVYDGMHVYEMYELL